MKDALKTFLYSRLVPRIGRKTFQIPDAAWQYVSPRFSQFGEDAVLLGLLSGKASGFYVDVGAYHPTKFSNTYIFYLKDGWRGLNIDANPEAIDRFKKERPKDINICAAISEKEETLTYYQYAEGAINTFSSEKAAVIEKDGVPLIAKTPVEARPLKDILSEYLPKNQPIDFMSIDCEGLDLMVLESNDWERFRPQYLLVEDTSEMLDTKIEAFANEKGYKLISWTGPTKIFRSLT